ncbi:MAG TPA: alpha/beta fold hydrolase [Acidimicrobiia bacterium]|nr:alpha/beta fold hydrolase [Acidimicrobiia bacterium]
MRTSAFLVLTWVVVLAGCALPGDPLPNSEVTIDVHEATTEDVTGVVEFFPPSGTVPRASGPPLIVLVPGGGWETADPAGMVPLAEALAHRGAIVATTTYRAADLGIVFPGQAEDVACAIAEAAERSRLASHAPGEVVVVGHSAGAHLGAIVTLEPDRFLEGCNYPPIRPDRFIGLAGPYDIARVGSAADSLFGVANPAPALLSSANPLDSVASRPDLAVLLIHGLSDSTVPIEFTESFAAALLAAGHAVTTVYPEGVDHHSIYSSDVAESLIAGWLDL